MDGGHVCFSARALAPRRRFQLHCFLVHYVRVHSASHIPNRRVQLIPHGFALDACHSLAPIRMHSPELVRVDSVLMPWAVVNSTETDSIPRSMIPPLLIGMSMALSYPWWCSCSSSRWEGWHGHIHLEEAVLLAVKKLCSVIVGVEGGCLRGSLLSQCRRLIHAAPRRLGLALHRGDVLVLILARAPHDMFIRGSRFPHGALVAVACFAQQRLISGARQRKPLRYYILRSSSLYRYIIR